MVKVKNKIRKNEFKDNNDFGSRKSDRWVSPHKAWKLSRLILDLQQPIEKFQVFQITLVLTQR